MTICIAVMCDSGKSIVLVGDKQVGVGFTSAEFPGSKFGNLFQNWSLGIAGAVANAIDVYNQTKFGRDLTKAMASYDVRSALENGYRRARLRQAEARFLANRGWTLEGFIDHGASKLPPSTFANIDAQIATFDFNTDLIVAGWGHEESLPSIYTITNPGVSTDHSKLGFWCVGSGATAAQMALFARKYSPDFELDAAVYFAYEAKIHAQRATGVGTTTDIYLLHEGMGSPIPIGPDTGKLLNAVWEDLKPRAFGLGQKETLQNCPEFAAFRTSQSAAATA